MRKKCNVVCLPTEKASEANALIGKYEDTNTLVFRTRSDIPRGIGQHLYFTAPSLQEDSVNGEEIRDGNWIIHTLSKRLTQVIDAKDKFNLICTDFICASISCQKVIATTDESLWNEWYGSVTPTRNIPKIPIDFVERFVKEQGSIKEVLIGYKDSDNTYDAWTPDGIKEFVVQQLDLNNSGQVKVYPVEERKYSLDEMLMNMQYYMEYCKLNNIYVTPQAWLTKYKHF